MISSWAAWILTMLGWAGVCVGVWLLAWHRGYIAGRSNYIGSLPGDAWRPESEAELLNELLDRERKNEPPRKYRREK